MDTSLLHAKGNLRVRACRHGVFAYFINDTFIGRALETYGECSEGEIDLYRQLVRPGMTVVEAGANIGTHTVFLAQAVGAGGRVIAFEPQPLIYRLLCTNLTLNNLMNVTVHQAALGSVPETLVLPLLDYRQPQNFGSVGLRDMAGRDAANPGIAVQATTLDSLRLADCHLIKADVEGMELAVLQGGVHTIDRFRPFLFLENDRREKAPALIEFLLVRKYRIYWYTPPSFRKNNYFGAETILFPNLISLDILCIPEERGLPVHDLREITSVENCNWPPRG